MRFAHLIGYIPITFRAENYWSCPLVCCKSYSPLKNVQTGFGVHPMDSAVEGAGEGWLLYGSKSAVVWGWPLIPSYYRGQECLSGIFRVSLTFTVIKTIRGRGTQYIWLLPMLYHLLMFVRSGMRYVRRAVNWCGRKIFFAIWRLFHGSFLSITVKGMDTVTKVACQSFYQVPLHNNIVTMWLI
jgi:hypothetical protein